MRLYIMAGNVRVSDEDSFQFGKPGTFRSGKREDVRVTGVGVSEYIPLEIRRSLVGLVVPTVFTKERLVEQGEYLDIPDGSRLSYSLDVVRALEEAGKYEAGASLRELAPGTLDIYWFEKEICELVSE